MSDKVLIAVVIAVVVIVIAAVIAYFVVRMLRGSMKITLAKNGFSPGEKVTGSFTMKTRKEIEGKRLFAALVGKEVTERREGDRTRTDTREIYRDEQTLEEGKTYPAGNTSDYSFELNTPSEDGQGLPGSAVGQALDIGLDLLSGNRTDIRWTVEVRLDAKGVDLFDSRSVTINIS
ncbi:MAG: hypothetical protein WC911_06435 [Thermoleophilia bacterium]